MTEPKKNHTKKKPFIVALTGGIASGKTAVSDAFGALGVPVVDTDLIARSVVEPGSPGLRQVVAAFGDGVLDADGGLDRASLRQVIFTDAQARERLEGILHPLIAQAARAELDQVTAPYAILVVPLLVESGLFEDADRVLVVDVPERVQIERLMQRDGVTEASARHALQAQASREQRLGKADDVLENTGTLTQLQASVSELHRQYLDWKGV